MNERVWDRGMVRRAKNAYPWENLVPEDVATRQRLWERSRDVRRAHDLGLTFEAIGVILGISTDSARASDMNSFRKYSGRSPVELWLERYHTDIATLAELDIELVSPTPVWHGETWPPVKG